MLKYKDLSQNFGLAFKNTLWFLWPSGIVSLLWIVLIFVASLVENGGLSLDLGGFVEGFGMFYLFILLPNISFFIASVILLTIRQRGYGKVASILISNIGAVVSWFLVLLLSSLPLSLVMNFGSFFQSYGGMFVMIVALFALFVFFIRSIWITFFTNK